MPEAFVPLVSGNVKTPEAPFTSFNVKPVGAAKSAGLDAHPAKSEACAKPQVTLQRNGDIVTGIRVQCGCGQVIELSCVY
jgi:hypothetical protein